MPCLHDTRLALVVVIAAIASNRCAAAFDLEDALTHRDIELIGKDVHFDADQREIAEALFDGYAERFHDQSAAHRNLIQSLYQEAQRATDRKSVNDRIGAANVQWTATRIGLNDELLASIRAILTEAQLERWPIVERDRRRRTMLSVAPRFYAEDVDLIDIADAVKLEPGPRQFIDLTLNNWAEELDGLLQARKAAQDQWTQVVEESTPVGDAFAATKKKECGDRLNQRSQSIRDLNVRCADLIFTQIPALGNADFRDAFNLAAYPIIYRATPADHYVTAALKLPDLSTEQANAMADIKRDYDDRVLAINDQLAVVMRRQEDADPDEAALMRTVFEQAGGVTVDEHGNALIGNLNGVASMSVTTPPRPDRPDLPRVVVPGLNRAEPDSPQGRLEQSKGDLIGQTIDSVFAILDPDQQTALPKPTAEQMLSPEESMRRVMEKAFSNAEITHNADGSVTFHITVEDESPSK